MTLLELLTLLKEIPFLEKIWLYIRKIYNLWSRPRLKITVGERKLKFKRANDDKELHYDYPGISIINKKKNNLEIFPLHTMINDGSYRCIIVSDPNFLRLNKGSKNPFVDCSSKVYKFCNENWDEVGKSMVMNANEELFFPIKLLNEMIDDLTFIRRSSLLFCPKKNVGITININRKNYEYGLKRVPCYECYLRYLAVYHQRAKKESR